MKRPAHDRGAARTLSLQPLLDHLRVDNLKAFAEQAGFSRRTVYNWMELGISAITADLLCIRVAKLHPSLVYGPVWWVCDDEDYVPGNLRAAVRRHTTWASGSLPSSSASAETDALAGSELSGEEFEAGIAFVHDSQDHDLADHDFADHDFDTDGFEDYLGGLQSSTGRYAVAG